MLRTIAFAALCAGSLRARLAPLLTGLIVAALAGCGDDTPPPPPPPPPTPASEVLLPTASPRCEEAFAAGMPSGTLSPGAVKGPAISLLQYDFSRLDEKYREGNPPHTPWRARGVPYYPSPVPSGAEAKSADAVQALVCIRQIYNLVGTYQPSNNPAVRLDWDVRVLRWPSGEQLFASTFQGPDPPANAELHGYGDCTAASKTCATKSGGDPFTDAQRWLAPLITP
jgi:hypothetical protein